MVEEGEGGGRTRRARKLRMTSKAKTSKNLSRRSTPGSSHHIAMRRNPNHNQRLLPKLAKAFFALASCAILVALATQLMDVNAKGSNQPRANLLSESSLRVHEQGSSSEYVNPLQEQLENETTEGANRFGDVAEEDKSGASPSTSGEEASEPNSSIKVYSYRIVKEYDHDHTAFTQGFLYDSPHCAEEKETEGNGDGDGEAKCSETFLESTGLNGQTSVRRVDLASGVPISSTKAEYRHFGEGLTRWKDKLIQLTWRSGTTLVYDYASLALLNETKTDLKDGWGLTNDESHLIATDSGHTLYFLDPEKLTTVRKVDVFDGEKKVRQLNELEYIEGEVWANIWQRNCVARIDPETGKVKGWILAEELTRREMVKNNQLGRLYNMDVLNGIAYDPKTKRVWLTGKNWSTVYEVELVQVDSKENVAKTNQCFAG